MNRKVGGKCGLGEDHSISVTVITNQFQFPNHQTYLPAHPTSIGERALELDTQGSWCHVSMFSYDVLNEYTWWGSALTD